MAARDAGEAAKASEQFEELQRLKSECLKQLLKRKPGQKHYKRVLRAYLDADAHLQKALLERASG